MLLHEVMQQHSERVCTFVGGSSGALAVVVLEAYDVFCDFNRHFNKP